MIELFGPTYKYNGEVLTKPEVIFINDHHYDEFDHCFHVKKLLENSKVDPKLHTLIYDHVLHDDDLKDYNCVYFPIFMASESQEFINADITPNWNQKTKTFNFMINKPRLNRIFLLQLIEHFKLTNYSHALPWKATDVLINPMIHRIRATTDNTHFLNIIDNVTQINIPVTDYKFGPEVTMDYGIKNGNFLNAETYKSLLKTTVFEPSCVSIITEPCYFEHETIHTEKTIMAAYSGTFPIWFGGWKLAQTLKRFGFDVFDDIVDHSYEDLPSPIERCYYAIERNLHLLTDFNKTKKLVDQSHSRFQHNLDLLQSNVFLKECFAQLDDRKPEVRSALLQIMPAFRHRMFEKDFKEVVKNNQDKNIDRRIWGTPGTGAEHTKKGLV